MTEKRYAVVEDDRYIYPIFFDNEQDGRELSAEEIVELLNGLHEENQLLKLQSETKLFSRRELEKENEQLKKEVENLKQAVIRAAFDRR